MDYSGSGKSTTLKLITRILDPHSGRPVQHGLVSVSVFHRHAMMADGYDTALLVLGPERGRDLAQRLGLRAMFIEEQTR